MRLEPARDGRGEVPERVRADGNDVRGHKVAAEEVADLRVRRVLRRRRVGVDGGDDEAVVGRDAAVAHGEGRGPDGL